MGIFNMKREVAIAAFAAAALPFTSGQGMGSSRTVSPDDSTITAAPSACAGGCDAVPWGPYLYTWTKMTVNTTITAATVNIIIDRRRNTTSTKTEYADLPPGVTIPPTASDGRRIQEITLPVITTSYKANCTTTIGEYNVPCGAGTRVTTMTYPDLLWNFPAGYMLTGEISKTIAGASTCVKAPLGTWLPFNSPAPTPPPQLPDSADPLGYLWTTSDGPGVYGPREWASYFPDEEIWTACSAWTRPAPVSALRAASLVTVTSTSEVDSGPEPTIIPSTRKPTTELGGGGELETPTFRPPPGGRPAETTPPAPSAPAPGTINPQPIIENPGRQPIATPPANNQPAPPPQPGQAQPVEQGPAPGQHVGGALISIIGNQGRPEASPAPASPAPQPLPVTVGRTPFTPTVAPIFVASNGVLITPGSTLILGDPASPTPIVLTTNAAGRSVFIAPGTTSTVALPQAPASGSPPGSPNDPGAAALPAPIVIAGQTLTPGLKQMFVAPGGSTLLPGGTVVLGSGTATTVVALTTDGAGRTVLVTASSGRSSITVAVPSVTATVGLGGGIISGLGGPGETAVMTGSSSGSGNGSPRATGSTGTGTGSTTGPTPSSPTSFPGSSGADIVISSGWVMMALSGLLCLIVL